MQVFCVCVFLVLAVLAVFGQASHFEFVGCDDDLYVYENSKVMSGLSVPGIAWALTHVMCNFYHPLTMISLMLDYQLHGLQAGGYHITNVLIHAASSVLLFLVWRQMTGALWRSAFVAAVFAVHPLRAESVAWVAERKDVLGAFFFMLTLGAYVRYVRKPCSVGRYLTVVAFYVMALLSKPTSVTLPFVLLLLDYWPLGRTNYELGIMNYEGGGAATRGVSIWALVKEKIPLLLLAMVACVAAYYAEGKAVVPTAQVSTPMRIGTVFISYAVYLRQMVWPARLALFYSYPEPGRLLWYAVPAFLFLAGISAWVLAQWRRLPWLVVGWSWYLGMMVPMIGIVAVCPSPHGDRNTYLPQIGLVVMVTWAVAEWSAGWKRRRLVLGGLIIAVTGVLTALGHHQASYWRNNEALWTRAVACSPENANARNNLGSVLARAGRFEDAIVQYKKALAIDPGFADAYDNLAAALVQVGRPKEAIDLYRHLLQIDPDYAKARSKLGGLLMETGNKEEAIAEYRKVIEIKPEDAEAHLNLGNALATEGQVEEGMAQYRQALAFNPNNAYACYGLGVASGAKEDWGGAIVQLRKALEIKPDFAEARRSLGKALLRQGDFDGALACLRHGANATAGSAAGWSELGDGFLRENNLEEAIACYRQELKTNPRSAEACANLGLACFQKGAAKEAVDAWQQSLSIKPEQPNVENNLAWVLATSVDGSLRNGAKAVVLAEGANQTSGGSNEFVLHTLAAAYAETGRYGEALTTSRRARELAAAQKNDDLSAKLEKEIKLYQAGTPMRDVPQ
jgi:tetratricopeptide (TPR) repeat protein